MKALFSGFAFLLLALHSFAQDLQATKAAQQACGRAGVAFDKKDGLEQHRALPVILPGKALVYLVQLEGTREGSCIGNCSSVVRFGLDGQWKGATWGNSFVSAVVDPGDHHLCVNWDTRVKKLQQVVTLKAMHAEPGRTYFFGVRTLNVGGPGGADQLVLEPLDEDEASMLLEAYPYSKLKPKS